MLSSALREANIRLHPRRLAFGPEWIVLGVNNICNLRCRMCDVGAGYEESNFYANLMGATPVDMPLELAREIFTQTARHFPRAKIGYAFTEPIIYPHLLESLAEADRLGLYTSMTTNALKLPALARQLAEAGLDDLFVSLDGPADVHNVIRGHATSFERAVEGIERVCALPGRKPRVSVFCTITQWNIGRLREFVTFFARMPLAKIGVMHTNFVTGEVAARHNALYAGSYPATASNMTAIDVGAMDLARLWDEVSEIQARAWALPVSFSPRFESASAMERYYRHPGEIIGRLCNDVFRMMMIKSDGTVIPAHGRCYQHTVGSLHEQALPEIWNSPAFGAFRRDLMAAGGLLPACARCCSAF